MKLIAVYNVFDGDELLAASIKSIIDHVDAVLIIWQDVSNYGEQYRPAVFSDEINAFGGKIFSVKYDPIVDMGGPMNERAKRNMGLDMARKLGGTHFIGMDCDEFYQDFGRAKELYLSLEEQDGIDGSVCRLQTYFREVTFQFDKPEDYYVPFIHKLRPETKNGSSSYPFYVDPTRTVNANHVVELPIFMHHYSWCRHDIMRKARNSSARIKIESGNILRDYNHPDLGEGYLLQNWNRRIKVVEDIFGLDKIFQ